MPDLSCAIKIYLKNPPTKMKKKTSSFDAVIDKAINVVKVIIFTNIVVAVIAQLIRLMK